MAVDTYRLGRDCEASFLIVVCIPAVGLKHHMRLAGAVKFFVYDVRRLIEVLLRILTLGKAAFVERVGHPVDPVYLIVNLYSVRGLGLVYVEELGQRLVVYLYLLRRGARVRLRISADDSDALAPLAYLIPFLHHYAALPAVCGDRRASYLAADAVGTFVGLDVPVRHDLEDTGHLLSFAYVYLIDLGVPHALKRVGIREQELLRQLKAVVVSVIKSPCGLEYGARTRVLRLPDALPGFVHTGQILDLFFPAQNGGCLHDSVYYLNIARAPACHPVLAEPVAGLFSRRIGVLVKQRLRACDEPRRAESALYRSAHNKRPLYRVQVIRRAYPFDSHDVGIFGNIFPARDA